ncbi:MCE family protein [Actinomadura parmotrematis]|uniref:MCE family protein n=1 Tax=Actinomadura parmotrematis TaxID=2864039 RepID=A0ABS7G3B0_9ACTN|nr:MlaD family protein [Actinomadura parmotrematis]MBW8486354.1 MCE family protein [Actinomadura parmotrematis]
MSARTPDRWRRAFTRSFRDRDPVAISLVTIPVLAALVLAAYAYGTLGLGQGGYAVSGVFAGTGGLQKGSEVQLAGVTVGKVTRIEPDFRNGHIVVTWKVDSGVRLGTGMHADIRLSNLLGGQYVKLSGPVAAPYLKGLPDARRRIPLERTSIPYTLSDTLGGASNVAGRLDAASVDRLLTEAAKVKLPSQQETARMLADLRKVSTALNASFPQVAAIIANSDKLTATLASKDEQLAQLLRYGDTLLKELARRRDDLAAALGGGSRVVKTLDTTLAAHQKQLNTVLNDFHLAAQTLTGDNLPSLNVALAWFGPAFYGMSTSGSREGRWMEGGFVGFGPVQPGVVGPQPNFNPPNYPLVPTGQVG